MSLQPVDELEKFYDQEDPWDYENTADDTNRRGILLGELSRLPEPKRVLDIGCGHGFITRELPGKKIIGVDISKGAIKQAQKLSAGPHISYQQGDIFDLDSQDLGGTFDMIVITGVVYPQYIGQAKTTVYQIIDELLAPGGILVSVHIKEWYTARFPYLMLKYLTYSYRDYQHFLEIYKKL